MKDHGDAEARVLLHPPLDGVGELRLGTRPVAVAGALDPPDPHLEPLRRMGGVEAALVVGDRTLAVPEAQHLRDLLLQRHAPEEVLHAFRRGERGVLIVGPIFPGLPPCDADGQQGTEGQHAGQVFGFHSALGTIVMEHGSCPHPTGWEDGRPSEDEGRTAGKRSQGKAVRPTVRTTGVCRPYTDGTVMDADRRGRLGAPPPRVGLATWVRGTGRPCRTAGRAASAAACELRPAGFGGRTRGHDAPRRCAGWARVIVPCGKVL